MLSLTIAVPSCLKNRRTCMGVEDCSGYASRTGSGLRVRVSSANASRSQPATSWTNRVSDASAIRCMSARSITAPSLPIGGSFDGSDPIVDPDPGRTRGLGQRRDRGELQVIVDAWYDLVAHAIERARGPNQREPHRDDEQEHPRAAGRPQVCGNQAAQRGANRSLVRAG